MPINIKHQKGAVLIFTLLMLLVFTLLCLQYSMFSVKGTQAVQQHYSNDQIKFAAESAIHAATAQINLRFPELSTFDIENIFQEVKTKVNISYATPDDIHVAQRALDQEQNVFSIYNTSNNRYNTTTIETDTPVYILKADAFGPKELILVAEAIATPESLFPPPETVVTLRSAQQRASDIPIENHRYCTSLFKPGTTVNQGYSPLRAVEILKRFPYQQLDNVQLENQYQLEGQGLFYAPETLAFKHLKGKGVLFVKGDLHVFESLTWEGYIITTGRFSIRDGAQVTVKGGLNTHELTHPEHDFQILGDCELIKFYWSEYTQYTTSHWRIE